MYAGFLRCCCWCPSSCWSWAVMQWGMQENKENHTECWLCKLRCLDRKYWNFPIYFQEKRKFPRIWEKSLEVRSSLDWRLRLHLAYSLSWLHWFSVLTPQCPKRRMSRWSPIPVLQPDVENTGLWSYMVPKWGRKWSVQNTPAVYTLGGCILVLNITLTAGHLW